MNPILNWFHSTLGVEKLSSRGELQTFCPKCGHEKFYFNLYKKIGWCHSAKCHWKPGLQDLINLVGFGPDETGYFPSYRKETPPITILLPEGSFPLITKEGKFPWKKGIDYLISRGVPPALIQLFDIRGDGKTVIIPVRANGELVSYVQRNIDTKHYHYPSGGMHYKTFLGWDEAQYWEKLTLVENTFVSLWLRNLNVTTNFGSHLSDEQALTIAKGSAKLVNLMWDEGAKTADAVKKLNHLGIKCTVIPIKGQPDDHSKEEIEKLI